MFSLPIDSTICTIRNALCPPSYGVNADGSQPGIVFCLDLDLAYYTDGNGWRVRRMAYVAMCGNTSVFVALGPDKGPWHSYRNVSLDKWDNTCNHDSCWRSDVLSFLSKLYFEAAETINDMKGGEPVAPARMSNHSRLWHPAWELVDIKHEAIERGNYKRRLVSIKPWHPTSAFAPANTSQHYRNEDRVLDNKPDAGRGIA